MIEPNYFEELNQIFQKTDADVVFFEFARVTENDSVISHHKLPELRADYYRNLMSLSEADTFGYTWVKAFRRSVISDVRFKENMMLFEDELFTLDALKKPLKMYYLQKELYHYVCAGSTSLARRTHQNYQELCDIVYCAWKELLNNKIDGTLFLKEKANHLSFVCKYYGLERVENPMEFFRSMSECAFLKDGMPEDRFLAHIREKHWWAVRKFLLLYKMQVCISKAVKKEYGNSGL